LASKEELSCEAKDKQNYFKVVEYTLFIWVLCRCALLTTINYYYFSLCFHMVFNNSSLFISM
jgi:hypothetical protein